MALAHGTAGVHGTRSQRTFFDSEHELRGGAKSILAIMHQDAAGVASLALDRDVQGSGSGDAGDNAQWQTFFLQQRTLLDMQFDKGSIVAIGQAHLVEGTPESGCRAQLGQRTAFRIFQARVRAAVEAATQHAAAQAPQAESCGLLCGKE